MAKTSLIKLIMMFQALLLKVESAKEVYISEVYKMNPVLITSNSY